MPDGNRNLMDNVTPSRSEDSTSATVTTLRPRPAPPRQRLTARPLARDLWDAHHADRAFGDADDGPAIPRIPSPRQPSDYGSAA